jgi:predicted DNA-binding transcriptional regulator AlpA
MTAKNQLPPVPPALADVSLIDGPSCAAAASISLSSWHELVRLQRAPQPAFRQSRCTRWRVADVRAWLIARAEGPSDDAVMARARHASAAAREPASVAKARESRAVRAAPASADADEQ